MAKAQYKHKSMRKSFDPEEAKKFLLAREQREKKEREADRRAVLEKAISILQQEFKDSNVEVYLIGSIVQPFRFSSRSDVDIVLKNFSGDRFEYWARLERKIGRTIELILFEACRFQEFVLKNGLKVI